MHSKDKIPNSPGWLQRVQEQSWEPEILISGIVLFALLQIPPYLEELARFLNTYSYTIFSTGTLDNTLMAILFTANYWLIAGFTAHLIFRSVWVAFVGLSYVYPQGMQVGKLRYASRYLKLLNRNQDYKDNILRLERICSLVFAVSFFLFMCVIGVFFFLVVATACIALLFELAPDSMLKYDIYIDPVFSILILVYLFDFVSLGLLKRIPYVSKVYYPFYRLMSLLTLAPLYRNIYYGFVSNHKSWKVGLWMLAFAVISVVMVRSVKNERHWFDVMELRMEGSDKHVLYHGHYESLMGNDPSARIQIPSDIIEGQMLRVFVVHSSGWERSAIFSLCDFETLSKNSAINQDSLKLVCLTDFYKLKLNDRLVSPEFLFHEKQHTHQVGLLAYVDISHLPRGKHLLGLDYNFQDGPKSFALVEFYKADEARP